MPSRIVLDTKPPAITVRAPHLHAHLARRRQAATTSFRVRVHARRAGARASCWSTDRQVVRTRFQKLPACSSWNGKIDGKPVRRANTCSRSRREDAAGNRAKPFPFAIVTVRYVELGRTRILARPGTHFALRVLTDAPGRVALLLQRDAATASPLAHAPPAGAERSRASTVSSSGVRHAAKAIVVVG